MSAKLQRRTPPPPPPRGVCAWLIHRQLELSLAILLVILTGNALNWPPLRRLSTALTLTPSEHLLSRFSRFIFLSFRKPETDLYFKGRDDAFYIAWWVVAFIFLRAALMQFVYKPVAGWCGIRSKRAVIRFEEQGWGLSYVLFSFSLGLYIMQTSDYRNLRTAHFWVDYPHDALPALTKFYYLVQTAFWIQQIIAINLEERRKDYHQMFTHHVITVVLLSASYVLNWTRIGNAILVTMDVSDIFLFLAKLLKYTGNQQAADVTFATFLISWIATRHVIFGRILWKVWSEPPRYIEYAWRSQDGYFWSRNTQLAFVLLLGALQVLMCLWLFMILRVLYGMVRGRPAEDTRSDDEDDGEDEDEEEEEREASSNGSERKKDR